MEDRIETTVSMNGATGTTHHHQATKGDGERDKNQCDTRQEQMSRGKNVNRQYVVDRTIRHLSTSTWTGYIQRWFRCTKVVKITQPVDNILSNPC